MVDDGRTDRRTTEHGYTISSGELKIRITAVVYLLKITARFKQYKYLKSQFFLVS